MKKQNTAIQESNLRGDPRALVNQPGRAWSEKTSTYNDIVLRDISETGTRVDMGQSLYHPGEKIKIYWVPVVGLPPIMFEGLVVWKINQDIGVKFIELSKKQSFILKNFVRMHREHFSSK